ncbi:hypothetical protein BKN38_05745 [Helicobacter sp. CLO-3]|uniref:glycosyltransferase family 39 protein n=1 Tax=unclassified Helicobacter TaxID=2593540 RepID=UPI0008DA1E9F|nr:MULTISPECIES: glycosyltransferase family 39 protein [unclassified Helicobacter]OHU83210.1 hypothetical protein BKN38_05745 [Helicobacter sp. CLO-3]
MKNIFNYFKENANNIYKILAILLIALGIIARLYNYIWHKDLWHDEALLALSIYSIPFSEIFFKPLPTTVDWLPQAAPLGFLAFTKLLGVVFGYSEHVLYFLPLICGVGTLILAYMIGKRLFDDFGTLAFVALVVGSMGLLHYSTEFKQYGIEAFIGFLLLYLYIRNTSLRAFSIIASICILFSNTAIFLIIPFLIIYIYIYQAAMPKVRLIIHRIYKDFA